MSARLPFQYSEERLAEAVGLSRADMKFLRDQHLEPDRHWKKIRGQIAITAAAVSRIWRAIDQRPAKFDLASCVLATNGTAHAAPTAFGETLTMIGPILLGSSSMPIPRTFTVTARPLNPYVILAADEHGARQSVWVGNNVNFIPHDVIQAVPHSVQPGFWRYVGQLPRDRRRYPGHPLIAVSVKK